MITEINDKITIWTKFNLAKLSMENISPTNIIFNEEQISINDRWFEVLTPSQLVRKRNKEDGYYRVIYIQINYESGEYYIGKANRPTWKQLERYQGSGLKFKNKFVVLLLTIVNSKVNARKAQKLDGNRRLKILSFGG